MQREPVRNFDRIVCVSCTWKAARLENKSTGRPVNPTVKTHTSHCVWGFVVCTSTCTHYSCCTAPELQYSACLFIHMPMITHQTVASVMLVCSRSVSSWFLDVCRGHSWSCGSSAWRMWTVNQTQRPSLRTHCSEAMHRQKTTPNKSKRRPDWSASLQLVSVDDISVGVFIVWRLVAAFFFSSSVLCFW